MANIPDEIRELKDYDDLYYNSGITLITDVDYDRMKEAAAEKYPDHSYFQEVGSPVAGGPVSLPFILGSLDKVKVDTIDKWLENHAGPYIVVEKLDGVSFMVEYADGEVAFAATRGDGVTGRDITGKAEIFCPKIESHFNSGKTLSVRCEAMLVGNSGERLGFKNNRNGAAGILNRDDTKNCGYIIPFFYEIMDSNFGIEDGNEFDRHNFLKCYFPNVPHMNMVFNFDNAGVALSGLLERNKKASNYDIDGLVITTYNYKRENVMRPKNKVAFKTNEEPVEAVVREVKWNVTRTGRIMPVVCIEPQEIGGVTVSKATGFNAMFIYDNKIGSGSVVKIVRSGDVIPYITEVVKATNFTKNPIVCPECGGSIIWKGVDLCCNNPRCERQSVVKVEYFLRTMGAENITEKTLTKLGIKRIEDLYGLDEYDIAEFDGFGLRRGEQIVNEIHRTLKVAPEQFIAAIGIPGVSLSTAKKIVEYVRENFQIDDVYDEYSMMCHLKKKDLLEIDGIGEVLAGNIMENDTRFSDLFEFLKSEGLTFIREKKDSISGLIFTLTGKGPMGRNVIQKMISSQGGIVKGINKKTNFLVTNNPDSQSGKAKKAREYGIEIISYEDLLEMLNA